MRSIFFRVNSPRRVIHLALVIIMFISMYGFFWPRKRDQNSPPPHVGEKDWHNYNQIKADANRQGPGENGRAHVTRSKNTPKEKELYMLNGFAGAVSDAISVHRSLPDIRHPDCRKMTYPANLPTVSIIIPFLDEHLSTLMRTVHSLLERSPEGVVQEVILVDDASEKPFLKADLEDYLSKNFKTGTVQLIRQEKRSGLILTRLEGARRAVGQVLIFIDSHCEANVNWLPPLLEPIVRDRTTVVCPFIDVIDMNNFAYRAQDEGARGAFAWNFDYKRLPRLPGDAAQPAQPFYSPIMAGGLFAVDAKWFWELGGYDDGLEGWGGEQYELSFKVWMCGGRIVDAPCSRIGHIYRSFMPYHTNGNLERNYK